jgi:hypothetical protein
MSTQQGSLPAGGLLLGPKLHPRSMEDSPPTRAETDVGWAGRGVARIATKVNRSLTSLSWRTLDGTPRRAVRPSDQKQAMFKVYLAKFPKDDVLYCLHRKYPHLEEQKWDFQLDYVSLCRSLLLFLPLTARLIDQGFVGFQNSLQRG